MEDKFPHLVVCVCTYKRPKMLYACLKSLSKQVLPDNIKITLLIIDNDAEKSGREALLTFKFESGDVRYVCEPRRGIATARNRALDEALALNADYVAFIDDDAAADEHWIAGLMDSLYIHIPILQGITYFRVPKKGVRWLLLDYSSAIPDEGVQVYSGRANNLRLSRSVIDSGLRFDTAFDMTGFEDIDFLAKAHIRNFEMRFTHLAVTYEKIHAENTTLKRFFKFAYAEEATYTRTCNECDFRNSLLVAPLNILYGAFLLLAAPIAWFENRDLFQWCIINAVKRIGSGVGRFAGVFGAMPQIYKNTVGK